MANDDVFLGDEPPLEIQLERELRALRERLASPSLSDEDRKTLRQKFTETEIRLRVIYEASGRPFLANPDKVL